MQWEYCATPKVLGMLRQVGDMEAPQYHTMIRFVLWVSDIYFSKETVVLPKKLIILGPHLPPQAQHAPSSSIPGPWLEAQENFFQNVFKYHIHQRHCNILIPRCLLRYVQVYVEIHIHPNIGTAGALANGRDDALNFWGIVRCELTSHNVPLIPPDAIWNLKTLGTK